MIAVLIDLSRLPVYALTVGQTADDLGRRDWMLVAFAALCAFAGAGVAVRYLNKTTIGLVRAIVATAILLIGGALVTGLIGA